MTSSLLGILCALVIGLVVAFPLGGLLRKYAPVFYVVALVLTAIYIYCRVMSVKAGGLQFLMVMMQKGYLSSVFLAIVMFTGCFDEGTAIRKRLEPIRGELSILSFIFILAHLYTYIPSYLPRLGVVFQRQTNVAIALVIAFILTALFIILSVTSFKVIKSRMPAKGWKNLQRFAYLMVALLLVHILLALGRSALASGGISTALVSLIFYVIIIGVYAVMRFMKYQRDKKAVQEA